MGGVRVFKGINTFYRIFWRVCRILEGVYREM